MKAFRLGLLALFLAAGGLAPRLAHAACAGPAGVEGDMIYNATCHVMQFCNGDDWIAMAPLNSGGCDVEVGLIHHWTLDDGAAGPYLDSAGSNNCTITGVAASVAGKSGTAIDFGTGVSADCGSMSSLSGLTQMTWSAWGKKNSADGHIYMGTSGGTADDGVVLEIDDGAIFCVTGAPGGGWEEASYGLDDTLWHHYACVFDGTATGDANRLKLYVDGVEVTLGYGQAIPASIAPQTANWILGPFVGAVEPDGVFDDVRIYSRALSPAEIADLYTNTGGI